MGCRFLQLADRVGDGDCRYLLGAMEQLVVGEAKSRLLAKVPLLWQALYESDVVEEETFLEWAKKGSKKFVSRDENKEVQAKAAPFIKWLAEAETESDEDDDDDEDAVEFESQQSPVKANGAPPKISARKAAATNGNDDADDIDIDDI